MSRIGKKPIAIPAGVKVALNGSVLRVEGPMGQLQRVLNDGVQVEITASEIIVQRPSETISSRALHGLTRTLVANMVDGVSKGFQRVLEIHGVGYRADVKGSLMTLALGYSHPVEYPLPEGVSAEVEKQTKITVKGIDKELVGATAAKIRSFREPEPYKGKGIKYAGERIIRKAGKTGKK
jgi:large subunit ribosomal protein L6